MSQYVYHNVCVYIHIYQIQIYLNTSGCYIISCMKSSQWGFWSWHTVADVNFRFSQASFIICTHWRCLQQFYVNIHIQYSLHSTTQGLVIMMISLNGFNNDDRRFPNLCYLSLSIYLSIYLSISTRNSEGNGLSLFYRGLRVQVAATTYLQYKYINALVQEL